MGNAQLLELLTLKNVFKAQAFRMLLALTTLASSALVVQAGQRWH